MQRNQRTNRVRGLMLGFLLSLATGLTGSGCTDNTPHVNGFEAVRVAQEQAIRREAPGDYYIGRRYFNPYYKFWGYIRRPGQSWHSAQLVMFDENEKLAPDREINQPGVDNNSEYRLYGHLSGERVYEPASNRTYPEFKLTNYELLQRDPPSIFPPEDAGPATTEIHAPE